MNEYTQKSLAKILIIALVIALGYFLYNTVFGAVTFNISGLTGIQFNTAQNDKMTEGLTHMWSFDSKDVDITVVGDSPVTGQSFVFNYAGTGENITGIGTVAWTSTTNISADDGSEANASLNTATSNYLRGTNFGFNIATDQGYVVTGIEAVYERRAKTADRIYTTELYLVDSLGASTTINHADPATFWPTTAEVVTFGSNTDTWGRSWSLTEINSTGFGVYLTATNDNSPAKDADIDYLRLTIYVEVPGSDGGSAGTTTDTVGSIDGTVVDALPSNGKVGQALSFDGVDNVVEFDSTVTFKTISFWMKSDITTSGIIDIASTTYQSIDISSNAILATGFDSASTTVYIDGKEGSVVSQDWHHITITNTEIISATNFQIGKISTTTIPSYFDGKIDNVRTYDRVLTAHEIQRLYNLGGTATINSDQTAQVSDGLLANFSFDGKTINFNKSGTSTLVGLPAASLIQDSGDGVFDGAVSSTDIKTSVKDSEYLYSVGFNDSANWYVEKRLLSDGSLVTDFDTDGIIDGAAASRYAEAIAIDSTYMYVVGNNDSLNWRIEKRLLSDGSLVTAFDTDGIIDGDSASEFIHAISIDSTYMYVGGYDDSINLRIEKRLLSDGSLVTAFGTDGVIVVDSAALYVNDLVIDSTYMYMVSNSSAIWRIEKRLLSDGSLVTAFDTDGIIDGVAASKVAHAISIDSTYMYVVGTNDSNDWRIEKRLLSDGSLVTAFDTDGILDGDSTSDIALGISIDSAYMYVVGNNDSYNWRIEKRLLSDGSLVTAFDTDGILDGDLGTNYAKDIVIDSTYLYIVGDNSSGDSRIEKRLLSDGSLVTAFDTDGIVDGVVVSEYARAIATDSQYMYIAGGNDAINWHIEKRYISDGSLAVLFGNNGIIEGISATEDAYDVAIDSTYMYVVGNNDSYNWRIEKRLLSDGSLVTAFDTDGILDGDLTSDIAYAVAIDSIYMYVVGRNGASNNSRIEKRLLLDGSFDTGFNGSGVIVGVSATEYAYDIVIDSTYMYVVGYNDSNNWRIEKRLLSDGSLVTDFDTDGIIDGDSASEYAYAISIDSTYMYVVGYNDSNNWRIEKRLLSDGSLVTAFDTDGIIDGDSTSEHAYDISIDSTYMYVTGYNDSTNWRIEKRLLSNGSLVTAFDTDGIAGGDSASEHANAIAIDSTYMYLAGYNDSTNWRIEKRLLSNGTTTLDFDDITTFMGYPGTFVGPTPVAGRTGQALSFDGIDDYIDVGDLTIAQVPAPSIKALSFWMKADDITDRPLINIDGIDLIEIDSSSDVIATSFPASTIYIDASSASPTITNDWHHVVVNDTTGVSPSDLIFGKGSGEGTAFDTDGIMDGAAASQYAEAIAIDSTYMYVVGNNDSINWRIEKRLLSDGSFVTDFDTDGIIDGVAVSQNAYAVAIDSTYMYVVGYNDSNNWRIEKRLLSDGFLVTSFDTDGIIDGDTASREAKAIVIDSTYMYVVGDNDSNNWRIEKRLLSDGSLVTAFDTDGIIDGAVESYWAYAIAIDSTYMYVVGRDDSINFRIEKRLLSDGSLVTAFDTDGIIDGVAASQYAYAIAIDATSMYVAGYNDSYNWHIEKRLLSDGSLVTAFDTDGIIDGVAASQYAYAIAIDATSMYVAGYNDSTNWYIEKRLLSDGSLVTSFDTDGIIDGLTTSYVAYAITTDSTYIYVLGDNDSNNWRIEKRLLSDGSLDTGSVLSCFDGILDEVRIYDKILTQNEIDRLYIMGKR